MHGAQVRRHKADLLSKHVCLSNFPRASKSSAASTSLLPVVLLPFSTGEFLHYGHSWRATKQDQYTERVVLNLEISVLSICFESALFFTSALQLILRPQKAELYADARLTCTIHTKHEHGLLRLVMQCLCPP